MWPSYLIMERLVFSIDPPASQFRLHQPSTSAHAHCSGKLPSVFASPFAATVPVRWPLITGETKCPGQGVGWKRPWWEWLLFLFSVIIECFSLKSSAERLNPLGLFIPRGEKTGGVVGGDNSVTVLSIWKMITNCSVFSLKTGDEEIGRSDLTQLDARKNALLVRVIMPRSEFLRGGLGRQEFWHLSGGGSLPVWFPLWTWGVACRIPGADPQTCTPRPPAFW